MRSVRKTIHDSLFLWSTKTQQEHQAYAFSPIYTFHCRLCFHACRPSFSIQLSCQHVCQNFKLSQHNLFPDSTFIIISNEPLPLDFPTMLISFLVFSISENCFSIPLLPKDKLAGHGIEPFCRMSWVCELF